jgi:H+/Cl- antiporter ClcA
MVARLLPTQTPRTLNRENHPENAPEPGTAKEPVFSLASIVGLGALCGLVGMALGAAALSTAFKSDNPWEPITLIPLVGTVVCILGGWIGAFFHMIRSEPSK